MALSLNRFALVDWAQIGDPLMLVGVNGVDNPFWTDGLETSRTEATLSTTAPALGSMTAAETNDGAGEYADGTYTVYVTYYRDAGTTYPSMESGAATGKEVTIASGPSDIALATVPVSSDAQVTDRRVYLLGGVLEKPYYVGAIGDNSTTTYTINVATATLQKNDTLDESIGPYPLKRVNADGLPPAADVIEVWNQRLWLAEDDTLSFSRPAPNFEDIPTTNSIIIPRAGSGVGAKITQLRVHKGFLFVFFEDAVFTVSGTNLDNFVVERALSGVGSSGGPRTVISVGDYLYFLDRQRGPMRWLGAGDPENIGRSIESFWGRLDAMRLRRACGGFSSRRNEIVWHVTEGRYDRNNRRLIWDLTTQTFAPIDHGEATATGEIRNEQGEKSLLEGTSFGDTFQYDVGDADGAYNGTRTGTPTTAAGTTLANTGATMPDAADCQGIPVYLYDSSGFLTTAGNNRVITREDANTLRLARPILDTVATYKIGGFPCLYEMPPIGIDESGQTLWLQADVRYKPTSVAATVYLDLRVRGGSWGNVGSFETDEDGRARIVVCDTDGRAKRGEDVEPRLRWDPIDNHITILGVTFHLEPTGGL